MPDYYTTFTAEETIKCSGKEFNALVKSMGIKKAEKIDDGEALTMTHEESALSVEFSPNRVLKNPFCVNSIIRKLLIIKGRFSVIFSKHAFFNTLLRRMSSTFMVNKMPVWTPFQQSSSKSLENC